MGIMTGGVVCPTAAKKCEVKLERISTTASTAALNSNSTTATVDGNKFKRPLSSIKQEDSKDPDDLRPPVKLKVRLGSNNTTMVKAVDAIDENEIEANTNGNDTAKSNNKRLLPLRNSPQMTRRSTTAKGVGPPLGSGASATSQRRNSGSITVNAPPLKKLMKMPLSLKKTLPPYIPAPAPPLFEPGIDSNELKAAVDKLGFDPKGNLSTSLMDGVYIKTPLPEPPKKPTVALTEEELNPPTPCVYVNNASEAYSPQLLDLCLHRPIVLIRNLAPACDIDLGLYSTKTLVEMHPNHPVEVRTQMEQHSDENWAPNMEAQDVWYCTSSRSHTNIAKYAEYQAEGIREYITKTVSLCLLVIF